jgi:repressor LexA
MRTNTGCADAGKGGPEGPGLTPLRRKIIRVIGDSVRNRGYPPSLREIGEAVGLASTSSVSYQMTILKAMGYVSHEAGRPRTAVLRLPGQDDARPGTAVPEEARIADVPIMGRIAAGTPVIADQLAMTAEDVIAVPRMLTGEGNLIALRVAGDSMIGTAIADGDWVIVRVQPDANNGDIVAAMLAGDVSADYEATVKTFKKADGHVWLLPHNPAYSPIPADSAVIIGKVVSVLRRILQRRKRPSTAATRTRGRQGRELPDRPPLTARPAMRRGTRQGCHGLRRPQVLAGLVLEADPRPGRRR